MWLTWTKLLFAKCHKSGIEYEHGNDYVTLKVLSKLSQYKLSEKHYRGTLSCIFTGNKKLTNHKTCYILQWMNKCAGIIPCCGSKFSLSTTVIHSLTSEAVWELQ